jgi:DNA/RNA endonuclease YhcR with UshA esterase domain
MNETNEKKPTGFTAKAITITIAALIVLFFIKIWIIDGLRVSVSPQEFKHPVVAQENAMRWDKTKHKISWKDASKYLGQYVEVEGKIVASHNNGKICYLNFDKNYQDNVALVIFPSSFVRFPGTPEKYYLGKNIRVEGRIKEYKGRMEIVLDSKDQVTILK